MTSLVLVDRASAVAFAPLASARPLATIRAGARLVHERWAAAFGLEVLGLVARPQLAGFAEPGQPALLGEHDPVPAGTIVAWSDFAPALDAAPDREGDTWTADGQVVAMRLASSQPAGRLRDGGPLRTAHDAGVSPIAGWTLRRPWDVIAQLPAMLAADAAVLASSMSEAPLPPHVVVLGQHPVRIAAGASVEPFTLLDARAGAIVIEPGAVVRSHSRLVGPFVLCATAQWLHGEGHTCVIGPHSKAHGEMSTTIVAGHANKGHDGFVGHSYLAPWSNLGAGTITSNLKNTYGTVQFAGEATGLQFLGALVGDHAKTGIGTRLTTGSRVGVGANVVGDGIAGPDVPPFAWGLGGATTALPKFVETAVRMMARRQVTPSDAHLAMLVRLHEALAGR
jgi:UDP-N-acetylglucosamine diphosphorylase/glucosamine-1-phosphate N-acetyltransferase